MQDPKTDAEIKRLEDEPPSQFKSEEIPQEPVVATVKEARQARRGFPVLMVLLAGLGLAAVVGAILGGAMF